PLSTRTSDRLTNLHGRQDEIGQMEKGLYQLTATLVEAPASSRLGSLVQNFVEAIDFILQSARDALTTVESADVDLLAGLCADRGELLGRIRNLYLSSEQGLEAAEKSLLLEFTTRFDRIVWTLRRLTM